MSQNFSLQQLQENARQIRISILKMLNAAGTGHAGGAMGIADVLTALYFAEMKIDPENPADDNRDRFVLSAAHMVPVLYATLAERGFFPKSELMTLRSLGSRLKGHTFRNLEIGVETTGGSLGQGIGIALGFALASRMREQDNTQGLRPFRTYCVIGDGESNEGSVWEAAMFAAKEKLDNLCVICDRNNIQLSNSSDNIMPLEPLAAKWEAFGWQVLQINGNDLAEVLFALNKSKIIKGKPTIKVVKMIQNISFTIRLYRV